MKILLKEIEDRLAAGISVDPAEILGAIKSARTSEAALLSHVESATKDAIVSKLAHRHGVDAVVAGDYIKNRLRVIVDPDNISAKPIVHVIDEAGAVVYDGGQLAMPDRIVEQARTDPGLAGIFKKPGSVSTSHTVPGGQVFEDDTAALNANLEAIASGAVRVVSSPAS